MKKFLTTAVILGALLCATSCGDNGSQNSSSQETSTSSEVTSSESSTEENSAEESNTEESDDSSVNEGDLKTGVYSGSSSFTEGDFSMQWNYNLTLSEDGSYVIIDDAGEQKSSGKYSLTDKCYTMTSDSGTNCTFVVQNDGTLKVTAPLPYGQATIDPDKVGGIILNYVGEETFDDNDETSSDTDSGLSTTGADSELSTTGADSELSTTYTISAGSYVASYIKESPMAGTVEYKYSAEIGDGKFSYKVGFEMGGTAYDGCAASGTYTVDGNKFIFTDDAGNVTEGNISADNTLVISLKASDMAKEPYEVTFSLTQ